MNEQIENIHSQMQIVKISLSGLTGKMETTEELVKLKKDHQKLPKEQREKRIKLTTQQRFIIYLTGLAERGEKYNEAEKTFEKSNILKFSKFVKVTN